MSNEPHAPGDTVVCGNGGSHQGLCSDEDGWPAACGSCGSCACTRCSDDDPAHFRGCDQALPV